MKKVISLLLVFVLAMGICPVLAEDSAESVLREELFDRIEEVCKNAGCTVFRNDVSIGVQKGTESFVVMNDTVTYMENGMIVNESLYVDGVYVKMPRKAIDIILKEELPKVETADDKYVFERYFKDAVNGDYVYIDAVNQSVEDEDCIVEIKEVLIGAENTYITAKITAKSENGKAIIPIWSDYSWMNFYGTTYGHLTTDLSYDADSIAEGDVRYFLYKIKSSNVGVIKNLRVETCYNHVYEYLDVEIEDQEEELRVDFDGGYVLLKPLRIEYYLTNPKGTEEEKEDTPNILIKFKDGSEKFIQELCNNTAGWTTEAGVVIDYVNCFKEELDLESVETVVVHGGGKYRETSEAYEEKMASFIGGAQRITNKTETDYGTIVEWAHKGYVPPYGTKEIINLVTFVRWDGESVEVSKYAPDLNDINIMAYESLEISKDGKTAVIKYPELKNTGTIQVTVDLVNCTATKDIIPYVEKEDPIEETPEDTETASGKCQGYSWMTEPPDTDVFWEYNSGTLTISGTGAMHDFYYTWGGRTETTICPGKPWDDYSSKIKKVVIEEGVNSISRYAFEGCVNLEEIVIADNVRIDRGAFHYLRNLEKVTLGKNCYLGEQAFTGCTALEKITIPEGATLYYGAFSDCYALADVKFDGSGINIIRSAFMNTAFYENTDAIYVHNELLWVKNATKLESYVVPEGTTRIGASVFSGENEFSGGKLKEIVLPESITEIGDEAFEYSGLQSISLNEGLKAIGNRAFAGCKFASVTLPDSLEYIGDEAFSFSVVESVTIGENVTVQDAGGAYSGGAFSNCGKLKTVIFKDGAETIANGMFRDCSALENVTITDSLKTIGACAFENCYSLKELPVGKGVVEIGNSAFDGCSNITAADISRVEIVGEGVFSDCNRLYKVLLNESLSHLPHSFFKNCSALTEVNIPQSITSIGSYALYGTNSLTGEFKIPEAVTYIGSWAFQASGFESITIPDGVTELGTGFAKGMENLTSITIPDGITKIPPKAFEGCENLTTVTLPDSLKEIGYDAFNRCSKLQHITVPDSVETVGENAFANCPMLPVD